MTPGSQTSADSDTLDSELCDTCSGAEISEQQLWDPGTAGEEESPAEKKGEPGLWRNGLPQMTFTHTPTLTLTLGFKQTPKSLHMATHHSHRLCV